MRVRDSVLKRSVRRLRLYHLASTYAVDVNDRTVAEIERALADASHSGPGRALVDRLRRHGVVDEGPFAPIPRRDGSDVVSIEIEAVARCNLACRHCFVDFGGAMMSDAIFAEVVQGARRLGAIELTFNGGEPLLHPRCVAWIDEATRAGLRTRLFTNATLVTELVAARLAAARVARVTVSVDGFAPAHDALRGAGSFDQTVAGIEHLVAAGVSVYTTTLVYPANEADLPAVRRFCLEKLGVRGVRISTIAPLGRAAERPDLSLSDRSLRAVYGAELLRPSSSPGASGHLPCLAGVDKLYVAAHGAVHGCHLFDGVAPALGDLRAEPLDRIHHALASGDDHRAPYELESSDLRHCTNCTVFAECRGGCRARAWKMTGDPFGIDPVACRIRGVEPASHPR